MKEPLYDSQTRPHPFIEELKDLLAYGSLLRNLTARDIKLRYRRSFLGIIWTLLNPLLMMIVLYAVFSEIFRFQLENYPVYLLSALLFWQFFSRSSTIAMTNLISNEAIWKKVYIPRSVFAIVPVAAGLVNLVLALFSLLLLMLLTGAPINGSLIFVPIALIPLALFTLGISLIVSVMMVYFADLGNIYEVLLTAWMYLTPIIYPIDIVPQAYRPLIRLNPMYYMLEVFRTPLYKGQLPTLRDFVAACGFGVLALLVGWWLFTRVKDELTYRV